MVPLLDKLLVFFAFSNEYHRLPSDSAQAHPEQPTLAKVVQPTCDVSQLPPEILERIFRFACTDGGYTGRSLCLASKRFRAVARPLRFHTVKLASRSPSQVADFLECYAKEVAALESQPTRLKPVRHLFLGTAEEPPTYGRATSPGTPITTESRRREEAYLRDLDRLIRLLAPDLEALSLFVEPAWPRGRSLIPLSVPTEKGFPSLLKLTLAGYDCTLFTFARTPGPVPLFPRLERLHQVYTRGESCSDRRVNALQYWAKNAPRLVELRLSHVDHFTQDIVRGLKGTFAVDSSVDARSPNRVDGFVHLRYIVIQLRALEAVHSWERRNQRELFHRLRELRGLVSVRLEVILPSSDVRWVPPADLELYSIGVSEKSRFA
ncbi:hypothetical protein BD414DRAFT_579047 [Trametes punicea]|nr:hypothetical protein BD414DRAFT_579047 [Trametes punicea]